MALMVPALLPPPAPFKLFVLAAGLANVRPLQFVLAIAVARGLALSRARHPGDLLRRCRSRIDAHARPHRGPRPGRSFAPGRGLLWLRTRGTKNGNSSPVGSRIPVPDPGSL